MRLIGISRDTYSPKSVLRLLFDEPVSDNLKTEIGVLVANHVAKSNSTLEEQ